MKLTVFISHVLLHELRHIQYRVYWKVNVYVRVLLVGFCHSGIEEGDGEKEKKIFPFWNFLNFSIQ